MVLKIDIIGINKTNKYLVEAGKKIEKNLNETNYNFMNAVKKSAKLRLASHNMTGELKNSIMLISTKSKGATKQYRLVVSSPYAIFVEEGYKGHFVSALTPTRNRLGTIGDVYNISGYMWIKPSKGVHFVRDAVEKQLSTFSQKLNDSIVRALK
jgi:hypothetical protein